MTVTVDPSGTPIRLSNPGGRALQVSAARFGDAPGIPIGSVLPRSRAWLTLPEDGSTLPWKLTYAGRGSLLTCE